MKRDKLGAMWLRIGRSLLGNALYFAGCGAASCAVYGCAQGAVLGALAIFFVPDEMLPIHWSLPLSSFVYAGWGAILGALVSLPSFAVAGFLRGAAPRDAQHDELIRACAAARFASLICAVAGFFSGPLLSFLTLVPLWVFWPIATCAEPQDIAGLTLGGALSGVLLGNVLGIWLGALFPGSVEAAREKSRAAQKLLRERK
jgi:hypothetical protein